MTVYRNAAPPRTNETSNTIADLVSARDRERNRHQILRKAQSARESEARANTLALRPRRVVIERRHGSKRVTIAPISRLVDWQTAAMVFVALLIVGVPFGIPVLGALFEVPVRVLVPIAIGFVLLVPLWAGVVTAIADGRPWHLDLTDADHFALHRGDPRAPKLFGHVRELTLHAPATPDPASLHTIEFHQADQSIGADDLSDRDVITLHAELSGRLGVR